MDSVSNEGTSNECAICGEPPEDDIPIDYYITLQRWLCIDCVNSYYPELLYEEEDEENE